MQWRQQLVVLRLQLLAPPDELLQLGLRAPDTASPPTSPQWVGGAETRKSRLKTGCTDVTLGFVLSHGCFGRRCIGSLGALGAGRGTPAHLGFKVRVQVHQLRDQQLHPVLRGRQQLRLDAGQRADEATQPHRSGGRRVRSGIPPLSRTQEFAALLQPRRSAAAVGPAGFSQGAPPPPPRRPGARPAAERSSKVDASRLKFSSLGPCDIISC